MRSLLFTAYLAVFLIQLQSCTNANSQMAITPDAYGSVDDILLVTDSYHWEGTIGDTFRYFFEALYPVTPQPEPIFSIRHIDSKDFNKVLKTHRSIVLLADLSDTANATTKLVKQALGEEKVKRAMSDTLYRIAVHRDRWAEGQTVIYWFAPDRSALLKSIAAHHASVVREFNKADSKKLLAEVYYAGECRSCNDTLQQLLNVSMKIPKDYVVARTDTNMVWMRFETDKASSNLFVAVFDDTTQLRPQSFCAVRNRITEKHFSTRAEGSYMQIDDRYLPVYYQPMEFNGYTTLHARGLWGMVGDFMGGSFVSYLFHDPANKRMVLIDGFVHVPGENKRPYLRRLDAILSSFAAKTESNK